MMRRTVVWLFAVVLTVSCLCYAEKTQEFQNNCGAKATGLRIVFYSSTSITSYGDAFSTVTPTGSVKEFVFSGGTVSPFGTFTVSWASSTTVKSYEWLTGDQPGPSKPAVKCSVTVSAVYPNLKEAIERAWDGAVICVEPGTYQIGLLTIEEHSFAIRGMGQTASDVVFTGPKYSDHWFTVALSATVAAENLKVDDTLLLVNGNATLSLKNVIIVTAKQVYLRGYSTVDIESSVLTLSSMSVFEANRLSIRDSVVEGLVSAREDAQFAASNSVFRGSKSKITASGNSRIEIRNCEFDPLSLGIEIASDFTGVIVGSGNIIAPSQLSPSGYAWPAGFIK